MKKVTVVFSKSKKWYGIGSLLIRLWTRKPYSHVSRILDWGAGPGFYQANDGKVNYEFATEFHRKHKIIKRYDIIVSKDVYKKINTACWQQAGKKYGMLQNLGIAIIDIVGIFGIKMSNPWKAGKNCSELIYEQVIIPIYGNQGYNSDTIKPHHIEKILEEKCKTNPLPKPF